MENKFHTVLERHFNRYWKDKAIPEEMRDLFNAINQTYYYYDRDLELLDRAMELSLEELTDSNRRIRNELDRRIAAQEKALANEQMLESININLREAIYRSSMEGKLIFANQAFVDLFGYDYIEKTLYVTASELYADPSERDTFLAQLSKNGIVNNIEILLKRKDNTTFWGLVNSKISHDSLGNSFIDGAVVDITHQKNSQEILQRTNQELQKTNQELRKINEELDQFVYSASHDLRAPLLSLLGLISVIELEGLDNIPAYLVMMKKSIQKLDLFIADIVDYSRNSRSESITEAINIPQIIDGVFEQLQYLPLSMKIKRITEYKINHPFFCDANRLKIIFNNLISNALRYHSAVCTDPYIKVAVQTSPFSCSIRVEDNGSGIAYEHQDKIFQMFYRASSDSTGSGLGLYIVKEVLNKLHGSITVYSKVGEGTSFSINIPNVNPEFPKAESSQTPDTSKFAEK